MRRFLSLLAAALITSAAVAADPPEPKDSKDPPRAKDSKDKKDSKASKGTKDSKDSKDKKDKKGPLAVGNDLPEPFHPYNVTGPKATRGKYHSLVNQYGLEPVVLIFARDLEAGEGFKKLLKGLDDAVEKNGAVRLHAFVVFVSDDLPEVVGEDDKADDKRQELAGKVEDLAKGLELKHVILCLDGKADLEKYGLDDTATYTVVLYRKYKVEASHALTRDKLTDDMVKQIMAEVADKLGATEK